jgi:DNA-binding NarL/FixJ family response regulator
VIRALIVDDHPILRSGLRTVLSCSGDIEVVAEAGSHEEALLALERTEIDVVVLDIDLPDVSGLDTLPAIRNLRPNVPVIVLTVYGPERVALRVMKNGAASCLRKDTAPEHLVDAVRKAVSGERYLTPELAKVLASSMLDGGASLPHETLSTRESEVLKMLAAGKKPTQIAQDLGVSLKSISTYRARLLKKMGAQSNADLTRYALHHKLIE